MAKKCDMGEMPMKGKKMKKMKNFAKANLKKKGMKIAAEG